MLTTVKQLWSLLDRRERLQLFVMLLGACVTAGFELVGVTSIMPFMGVAANPELVHRQPALHRLYVELGFTTTRGFLMFWAGVVLSALTLANLVTGLNLWLSCRFGYYQQRRLSRRLYLAFLRRPYAWHLERHSAELLEDLKRARELTEGVYRPLTMLLARGATTLFIVVWLLWVDPLVAVLAGFFLGGSYVLIFRRLRSRLRELGRLELEQSAAAQRFLADSLGTVKQIKLGATYEEFCRAYDRNVAELTRVSYERALIYETPRLSMHSLANFAVLGLVIYLQATVARPEDLIPLVSLFALAAYRVLPALQQCLASGFLLSSYKTSVQRLATELSHLEDEGACVWPEPRPMRDRMTVRNLRFAYVHGAGEALADCSLEIRRGTRVGLVGATGSGKTTLLNLLVGLLEPTSGTIEVDGAPLSAGWQRTIGYVPQDVYLADDTVRGNIALGQAEVSEEKVVSAARRARLHDFIQTLPGGYDTLVGERGIRLSGGQRQRLGLARALYGGPEFLVLDEATSALDSGTEAEVIAALDDLEDDCTIVTVAHRFSTVQKCDIIYVLAEGRVMASGNYAELMDSSPVFRSLAPL